MSRRKNRHERREQARAKNKERYKKYDDFEKVASLGSLYKSAKNAANGVSWKVSVQRYILSILFRSVKTRRKLLEGKDIREGFIKFIINERGKTRQISSVRFSERVVQKSYCVNSLIPILTRNLIYDNSASQKGKGTLFAILRTKKHLQDFYKKNGLNGYILNMDFKGYFENINHDKLIEIIDKNFEDERLRKLAYDFITAFDKGLGLGSESCQIEAIAYTNSIDHFIKEKLSVKGYEKYMDDSYILCTDKTLLKSILSVLTNKYSQYGVKFSKHKTHISKLNRGFKFLKTRFFLTDSGKVIMKPCRESITNERRKLKRQTKLFDEGIMTPAEIKNSYISFRGSMIYKNARKTIHNMDKLYNQLFERSKNYDSRKTIKAD